MLVGNVNFNVDFIKRLKSLKSFMSHYAHIKLSDEQKELVYYTIHPKKSEVEDLEPNGMGGE